MSIRPNPFLDPAARCLQFLPRRPSLNPRHPLPVFVPVEFKAQKGEPTLSARVKATKPQQPSLLWGHRQLEFPQAFG
jgi:hypothetical protein